MTFSIFKKINFFFMSIFDFLSFRKKTDKQYNDISHEEEIMCLNDYTNTFSE